MSYASYSSTRKLLVDSSDITSYIPSNYIRVGFPNDELYVPSITIHQTGGDSWGYLGYNTASVGEKLKRENSTFQINIFNNWSIVSSQRISDYISKALLNGIGYRRVSQSDDYNNEIKSYVNTQIWTHIENVDD